MWFNNRKMSKEDMISEFMEFVWAKETLIQFPKREKIDIYDYELDLTVNPNWIEWEIEIISQK